MSIEAEELHRMMGTSIRDMLEVFRLHAQRLLVIAKALGLTIPPSLLGRADEVIQ